ncbi:crotonase/enoyl-CoA hydratase family protein [Kangiella sp. TOML190]|uniref:crotonase/enoyl-CoA hydratase family protein n=1 Tax=Kangiella sp. TOML190 TaxID=2931351 RepID=UPI00203CA6B9|nr:crotonase/enoyl-CoA hydratase family protein [Kangiella sp. TOML190]
MRQERLNLTFDGKIARVELNRTEKRNAVDYEMFLALRTAQRKIAKQQGIRLVIISAQGQDFCSGLDVKSVMADKKAVVRLMWKWLPGNANLVQQVSIGWRRLKMPVIAIIQGRCWGAGLQIALGADYRIAHTESSFAIMESKWGLIPDMAGNISLRDIMNKDQALRLAMSAEEIAANKALELGLISEVVSDLNLAANSFADKLLERSPDAVATVKQLYHRRWQSSPRRWLASETWAQWRMIFSKNQSIAVKRQQGNTRDYLD